MAPTAGNQTVTGAPHASHTANVIDPTIDSTGTTGTGHQTTASGTHNSKLLNKLDPTVNTSNAATGTADPYATTGHHATTGGPHNSNIANRLDPTVNTSHTTTTGGLGATGHHTTTGGPHNSTIANRLDPTVNTSHATTTGGSDATGHVHHHTDHHAGTHGKTGLTGNSTTTGGYSNQGLATGGHHTSGTHGHHAGSTGHTAGVIGGNNLPGPAANTAGPHKSDLLNKVDPRVDSDLDGSTTVGGNKTYAQ